MKKNLANYYNVLILLIIIGAIYFLYNMFSNSKTNIANLTDSWINAVTVNNNSAEVANMFCRDGSLVGTVSQEIRRSYQDIKLYFDFFVKLPGIKVISRHYNISKVTSNVYLNTAFISWIWEGLERPIIARMSFVFRDNCIFQLHSSKLPELNDYLLRVSGKK